MVAGGLENYRSEGFPARDIWFLGVVLPGLDQMQKVLGTSPPLPSPSPPSFALPGWAAAPPDPPLSRPAGLQDSQTGLITCSQDGWFLDWFDYLLVGWLVLRLV